jgi:molybdate transport system permease protein
MNDLWQPLRTSLLIAGGATAIVTVLGVSLAYLSVRLRFFGKSFLEAILILPLVLPPTVVGYFLIVLFGRHGWIGATIAQWTGGYTILFRPEGGILAAMVVSLPLLYLTTKAAFAGVDRNMESVATLMGANRLQVFWHVSLPLARRGIASGVLLAFGRALGEFGATTMVMGNLSGRQTLPISIYSNTMDGDIDRASAAVWALSALSLIIVLFYNRSHLIIDRL